MAILMSFVALAIDSMLPALNQIGEKLNVENPNDVQLIVSMIFLGMSLGLMLYGPLSDSYGRKKAIYLGVIIFTIGNIISFASTNFTMMLVGRVLQGFGAAASRVVTMAMIRDKYEGNEMGKILAFIMVIFILVPAIAPSIGQVILFVSDWRSIFAFNLALALVSAFWLHFRQAETMALEHRRPFSFTAIKAGIIESFKHPHSRSYTIAAGLIFGAFVGYLSSAQQIMQNHYELAESFSLYFGSLALVIGFASFVNGKLVMKHSMKQLSMLSLMTVISASFLLILYMNFVNHDPHLFIFLAYMAFVFFSMGILFGNLNTLAVEPLGHIAGVATSVISSIQTFMSVGIGGFIGYLFNDSIEPLVSGFFICGLLSYMMIHRLKK